MFCSSCGKQIPDESNFCLHCGYSFTTKKKSKKDSETEWEYDDCVIKWDDDDLPQGKFGLALSDYQIKAMFWDWYQQDILVLYQKWLDKGWEPITEVGSSAIKIANHKPKGFFDITRTSTQRVMDLVEFRVSMRRQKK